MCVSAHFEGKPAAVTGMTPAKTFPMSWTFTDIPKRIARAASSARESLITVTRTMFSQREHPQLVGMPFQWRISDDDDLAERVRVDLSAIPTTHAIEVHAARGRVSLQGTVRREERDAAVELARAVAGVKEVEDLLVCEDSTQT
jgi:hypothetical protein